MDFEIGTIVNAQGIKGEVRVLPSTFDVQRFSLLQEVGVAVRGAVHTLRIERCWYHKQFVILKFAGVDDRDAAERLKTAVLRIPEELALPLGQDEYYWRDLYGMTVVTESGEALGELTSVLETGANDVYIVDGARGEWLIPAIRQCVRSVDVRGKTMTVRLPNGLSPTRKKDKR